LLSCLANRSLIGHGPGHSSMPEQWDLCGYVTTVKSRCFRWSRM